MSLPQATQLLLKANKEFYTRSVLMGLNDASTVADAYAIEYNSHKIYDQMMELNADLMLNVDDEIKNINSFNVRSLIVEAVTTGVLAICSVSLYFYVSSKRVQMLALFCRIQKSHIIEEWQRVHSMLSKKGSDKMYFEAQLSKQGYKDRMFSDFISQKKKKCAAVASLFVVAGLIIIPFLTIFLLTREQMKMWKMSTEQVNLWGEVQARFVRFTTENMRYYSNLDASDEYKYQISLNREEARKLFREADAKTKDFFSKFGSLENQAYLQ